MIDVYIRPPNDLLLEPDTLNKLLKPLHVIDVSGD